MFAAWGRFVYRWRWATLVLSAALLGLSIVGLGAGGTLTTGNPVTSNLEAARAQKLIDLQPRPDQTPVESFTLIFASPERQVGDPSFRAEVESAVAPLQRDSRGTR